MAQDVAWSSAIVYSQGLHWNGCPPSKRVPTFRNEEETPAIVRTVACLVSLEHASIQLNTAGVTLPISGLYTRVKWSYPLLWRSGLIFIDHSWFIVGRVSCCYSCFWRWCWFHSFKSLSTSGWLIAFSFLCPVSSFVLVKRQHCR